MKSLKIAFAVLLCVTILSVGASVVCAVIAGNVAESFRDYRSSVITALSSLHAQLNSSKQAFADALNYLDGAQASQDATEPETETPAQGEETTEKLEQDTADALKQDKPSPEESTVAAAVYTVKSVNGQIAIFDQSGALVRTLNVAVATLPRTDREQLAVGIVIRGEEELNALIEDYSG